MNVFDLLPEDLVGLYRKGPKAGPPEGSSIQTALRTKPGFSIGIEPGHDAICDLGLYRPHEGTRVAVSGQRCKEVDMFRHHDKRMKFGSILSVHPIQFSDSDPCHSVISEDGHKVENRRRHEDADSGFSWILIMPLPRLHAMSVRL